MFITKQTCKTNILATFEEIKKCEDKIEFIKESISKIPVDSKGNVKAVAKGTATIKVTTKDGNKTSTCQVTVK